MDARTGKHIRLGRLRDPQSGKYLIIAYSHGVLMGAINGLRTAGDMRKFATSIHGVGGLMIAPGLLPMLEDAFIGRERPSLVIHLDWQSHSRSNLSYEVGRCAQLAPIERVVAAGADAVMTYLYVGHDDPSEEREEIVRNASIVEECRRFGLPVMIEPRSAREKTVPGDKTDPSIMSMYCRISAEIGADLIKCIYPGSAEAMQQIVEECPAPVLVAGGARTDDPAKARAIAQGAIDAGAEGLVFGRNVYQSDTPQQVIDDLLAVVRSSSTRA